MALTVAFLGAKEIGTFCLQQLLEAASTLNIKVVAIRSRAAESGSAIIAIAEKYRIPYLNSLGDLPETDFIISVQHHELLRQKEIVKARKIAVNLHLAPLPEFRGCNQFSYAILEDAQEFGVTLHQMDTRIDHGAILFESRFPVPKNCWVNDLYELTIEKAKALFTEALPNLVAGNYQLTPQHETGRRSGVLHLRKEIQQLKKIPIGLSKEETERRIRATLMAGFEPPYCLIGNRKIYFSDGNI